MLVGPVGARKSPGLSAVLCGCRRGGGSVCYYTGGGRLGTNMLWCGL